MNDCCWRWRYGAYSVNKEGKPSTKHNIKFCPVCGESLEPNEEQLLKEQIEKQERQIELLRQQLEEKQKELIKKTKKPWIIASEYCNQCPGLEFKEDKDRYECSRFKVYLARDKRGRILRHEKCYEEAR